MHLLVTRPEPDAGRLAVRLEALGYRVTRAPLMQIRKNDAQPDLTGVQALAFTSANGVRAFAALSAVRDLPVFAVGASTAEAARAEGFTDVHVAGGDVVGLTALIAADLAPDAGSVFHAAGRHVAGDLAEALTKAGFNARREALYEAEAVGELPETARRALEDGSDPLHGVLFFSPRTAELFEALVVRAALPHRLAPLTAYCLSPAVTKTLTAAIWKDIAVARAPDQPSLLALLPPGQARQPASS